MRLSPRVSVVIPHLNEPGDLRRCLRALAAQRVDGIPFEIIVVDNGSAELPVAVCAAVPGVRLESEAIPGPGPARNRGASVAQAELLAFIDADCIAEPGWIRSIVEFMDQNPRVDFVGGDIRILLADPERMTAIEAYESVYSYRAKRYVEQHGFAATGNMAVRAEVFRAVGPFGGISSMEDTEWGQKATAKGYKIAYVADAMVRTASCKSFAELTRRWDRHIAHEFRQIKHGGMSLVKWVATSGIIAASPGGEIIRILRSDRVSGLRDKCLALACLTRVRLYRARRMLGLAFHDNTALMVGSWNRENS
ncbi:glycosyltransferase family A protein [Mesorhizobium sp. YR577]|uniref:glycosyltransferase n=1 Tax=Mesorhizobium sp. YR577 TaxID=1884373 RepID=UPI0008E0F474|nr:glycosyltransferase family A protein [Mesorhizobium sp. YR577]SFU09375.1 Glycosyltransferase like family 2 [Mesorhizobium sp. YR577]